MDTESQTLRRPHGGTGGPEVAIVGGGLAGLALSIQLAKAGHSVILFEKEQYPFHKVCGEYISMESWDFLVSLGIDLPSMQLPVIKELQVSGKNGKLIQQKLPLGGFGISRYLLDAKLAELARAAGVRIEENTKVNDIIFTGNDFVINTSQERHTVKVAAGSFGKRSNLDIKWKRPFIEAAKNKLNNYIGVKYHVQANFPADIIALHTFDNGYCGIVKIEGDKYNLCYLTTAENLQNSNGSIPVMEQNILSKNPHLKKIFSESRKCMDVPVTISQISFDKKSQVEHHVLMIGDAAGMITPLCGNGMSMALHASKLAATQIDLFLKNTISRTEMETEYEKQWQRQFAHRLLMGRRIQRLLNNQWLSDLFIGAGRAFPVLIKVLIKQTHGKPF